MPSLAQTARSAADAALGLLEQTTESGDPAGTIAAALAGGHALFLLPDEAHLLVARELADGLRRRFQSPLWPPVLTITARHAPLALAGCEHYASDPLSQQAQMLVSEGDAVLLIAGEALSRDMKAAVAIARAEGAALVSLGRARLEDPPDAAVALPDGPPEQLVACAIALAHALADDLAARLPEEPPEEQEPSLVIFGCTNCGTVLAVPRHLAGRRGVCLSCYNNTILAPDLPEARHEKRAHLRFALRDCRLEVEIAQKDKPPVQVPGTIALENLSPGGLLFTLADSPLEFQPDDRLHLAIHTPAFQRPLRLDAVVRRVTRENGLRRIGAVFDDCPPSAAERLRILERNLVLRNLTRRTAAG